MMIAPIELRRLSAGDAMRMQTIVAMLPQPEWRGAEIPSLSYLARALADPDVYVFAAFEGKRPMGFVSAYRFPSLAKQCDLVYMYDVYVAAADQDRGVGRGLMDRMIAEMPQGRRRRGVGRNGSGQPSGAAALCVDRCARTGREI